MASEASLLAVLADAQRVGMLGERPVEQVVDHARAFAEVLGAAPGRVVDLGTGAGVPGLVIAVLCPTAHLTMVDRRQKRTDFVERAIRRLDLTDRCQVWCGDVSALVRQVCDPAHSLQPWDVAVSRGFGPPEVTVSLARGLVRSQGRIVLSEPPEHHGDRWPDEVLDRLGVERVPTAVRGIVVLSPKADPPA